MEVGLVFGILDVEDLGGGVVGEGVVVEAARDLEVVAFFVGEVGDLGGVDRGCVERFFHLGVGFGKPAFLRSF